MTIFDDGLEIIGGYLRDDGRFFSFDLLMRPLERQKSGAGGGTPLSA
jgi:hypothetical protein